MNEKHIKGGFNETKGKVKQKVGKSVGDRSTEAEGVVDRVKGRVQKGIGDVKDAVKSGIDTVREKFNDRDRHSA